MATSTRQSGRRHAVAFRYACDRKLREALMDFVGSRRFANDWAADIHDRVVARG